jgi:hypothetical protein
MKPRPGVVHEARINVTQKGRDFVTVHALHDGKWLMVTGDMVPSAARAAVLAAVASWLDGIGKDETASWLDGIGKDETE